MEDNISFKTKKNHGQNSEFNSENHYEVQEISREGERMQSPKIEFEEKINKLSNNIEEIDKIVQYIKNMFFEQSTQIAKTCEEINTNVQGLVNYQSDTASRLRRFEEGYDFQILKNFTKPIFREIYTLENRLSKVDDSQKEMIQDEIDALVELLDRNSITRISPELGSEYAGQEKYLECGSIKVYSENYKLNGKIASIVHMGFLYEFNNGNSRVLSPAKVLLYTNEQELSQLTIQPVTSTKAIPINSPLAPHSKFLLNIPKIKNIMKYFTNEKLGKQLWLIIILLLCAVISILGVTIHKQSMRINQLENKNMPVQSPSSEISEEIKQKESVITEKDASLEQLQKINQVKAQFPEQ